MQPNGVCVKDSGSNRLTHASRQDGDAQVQGLLAFWTGHCNQNTAVLREGLLVHVAPGEGFPVPGDRGKLLSWHMKLECGAAG